MAFSSLIEAMRGASRAVDATDGPADGVALIASLLAADSRYSLFEERQRALRAAVDEHRRNLRAMRALYYESLAAVEDFTARATGAGPGTPARTGPSPQPTRRRP